MRLMLSALTTYAVEFRYPGASANQSLANQAFQDCSAIRQTASFLLDLLISL